MVQTMIIIELNLAKQSFVRVFKQSSYVADIVSKTAQIALISRRSIFRIPHVREFHGAESEHESFLLL
jgi:hypothetical protein